MKLTYTDAPKWAFELRPYLQDITERIDRRVYQDALREGGAGQSINIEFHIGTSSLARADWRNRTIYFNVKYLRDATLYDIYGVILHELAHFYRVGGHGISFWGLLLRAAQAARHEQAIGEAQSAVDKLTRKP